MRILCIVFLLVGCSSQKLINLRKIAGEHEDNIRMGILKLPKDGNFSKRYLQGLKKFPYHKGTLYDLVMKNHVDESENFLYILGIDKKKKSLTTFDARKMGFTPIDGSIKNLDPKFLFAFTRHGIQKVYSFEIGSENVMSLLPIEAVHGNRFTVDEHRDEKGRHKGYKSEIAYIRVLDPEPRLPLIPNSIALPWLKNSPLLKVKFAKRNLVLKKLVDLALSGAEVLPHQGGLITILKRIFQGREKERVFEASVLETYIRLSMEANSEGYKNELMTAFREDHLVDLASSLLVRYNPTSDFLKESLLRRSDKLAFYEQMRKLRELRHNENLKKLMEEGNQKGYVLRPLNKDFVFVYLDKNAPREKKRFYEVFKETQNVENIKEYYESRESSGELIPLGIFDLTEHDETIQTLVLNNPDFNNYHENIFELRKLAFDLAGTFIPLPFVTLTLNGVEEAVKLQIKSIKGRKYFHDFIRSEGALSAVLQSGIVQLDLDDVLLEAFEKQAEALSLSTSKRREFRSCLKNGDDSEKENCVRNLMEEFRKHQTRNRLFTSRFSRDNDDYDQKVFVAKKIHWYRLKLFLDFHNQRGINKFNEEMDENTSKLDEEFFLDLPVK